MAAHAKKKKRAPVEVVTGKNITIPIYFSPIRGVESYQVAFYKAGKRERERVRTLEAARARAKELIEELSTGTAHVETFTAKQVAAINGVVEILQPIGVSITEAARQFAEAHIQLDGRGKISDAVKLFLDQQRRTELTPIKFPDLVEKFLVHLREQKKSRRYTLDMQSRLHTAAHVFTGFVMDIHATAINEWLGGMKKVSGRTKNNYRSSLSTLFSFARDEGHLLRGNQTEAEFSRTYNGRGGEIGTYTSEALKKMLFHIEPRFVPFIAIGAFAGLRSVEIVRLEWPEVKFHQNVIEIKPANSKTATRRLAPLLPSLAAWLEPFKKETGKVLVGIKDEFALSKTLGKAIKAMTEENGEPMVKTVPNGLRHSFISYRMAVIKNTAEVALEAGNSPRTIFEHYRELKTESEGIAWFGIKPSKSRLKSLKEQ